MKPDADSVMQHQLEEFHRRLEASAQAHMYALAVSLAAKAFQAAEPRAEPPTLQQRVRGLAGKLIKRRGHAAPAPDQLTPVHHPPTITIITLPRVDPAATDAAFLEHLVTGEEN